MKPHGDRETPGSDAIEARFAASSRFARFFSQTMTAEVVSRCRRRGVRMRGVRADGARLVGRLAPGCELSIALVDDEEIRVLNRDYRDKDRPTDVLAFPMDESTEPGATLGDVVISLDTAIRQAREAGIDPQLEVRTLLVHGFLHLLGYDHERSPAEAKRMFRRQRTLLRELAESDS